MLVFARREGEVVRIGDDIKIEVVSIRRDERRPSLVNVKLAIDAPREITVHREEIYQAIQRDKEEKAKRGQVDV